MFLSSLTVEVRLDLSPVANFVQRQIVFNSICTHVNVLTQYKDILLRMLDHILFREPADYSAAETLS